MEDNVEEFIIQCVENFKTDVIIFAPSILKIFLPIIGAVVVYFILKIILNKIYRWWKQP